MGSAKSDRRSSRPLIEPDPIEACGRPSFSATRQPAHSPFSRTMTSGRHASACASRSGIIRSGARSPKTRRCMNRLRRGSPCGGASAVQSGPLVRSAGEVLEAGARELIREEPGAADRDLVPRRRGCPRHGQQRVEVADQGQGGEEDAHRREPYPAQGEKTLRVGRAAFADRPAPWQGLRPGCGRCRAAGCSRRSSGSVGSPRRSRRRRGPPRCRGRDRATAPVAAGPPGRTPAA